MKNKKNNQSGISSIVALLIIIALLVVIFIIRASITINRNKTAPSISGAKATVVNDATKAFNSKLESLEGASVGTLVKTTIQVILSSNAKNERKILVNYEGIKYSGDEISNISEQIVDGKTYNVKISSYTEDGFIEQVSIVQM